MENFCDEHNLKIKKKLDRINVKKKLRWKNICEEKKSHTKHKKL